MIKYVYMKILKDKKVIFGAVILLIVIVSLFFYSNKQNQVYQNPNVSENLSSSTELISSSSPLTSSSSPVIKKVVVSSYASKCGLTVTSPAIGSKITFPLTIKGTIDNSKASKLGCSWNVVSSRAGDAQIFYDLRNQGWTAPGVAVPMITSTGAVASTTAFSVGFNLYAKNIGLTSGTPIKITFTELKSLDNTKQDTFDLLVYLK